METTIKYRYAIVDGENHTIRIEDVDDELATHSFSCPSCHNALIPVRGEIRQKHFRHKGEICQYDNYLHALAEKVFIDEYKKCIDNGLPFLLSARVPIHCNKACVLETHVDCRERYVIETIDLTKTYTEVSRETRVEVPGSTSKYRQPDILLQSKDGKELWIEIWVSNETKSEKALEGPIVEIKIDAEEDVELFRKHYLKESESEDNTIRVFNKERIFPSPYKSTTFPCEAIYKCEYDGAHYSFSLKDSSILSRESTESEKYVLCIGLNWNGVYSQSGTNGVHLSEEALKQQCIDWIISKRIQGVIPNDTIIKSLVKVDNPGKWIKNTDHSSILHRKTRQAKQVFIPDPYPNLSTVPDSIISNSQDARSPKKILEGLDPAQRQAVESIHGPVLIVAGAGSGKTRVLTSRIAYILATEDIDPARILALTFTKKAAGEMKERIAAMVGDRRARRLVMGTFHSVFVRFLRDYAESLGYPKNFTIYDQSDSTSAVKACIKELKLDDKVYKPREVLSRISSAKNALIGPVNYKSDNQLCLADAASKKPRICDVYDLYQKKLKASGVMDFDDILVQMNKLLRSNAEALQEISGRFSYILVDEYQDTNYPQYLILQQLARPHHNICVVGDDSQSIYAFRGARIQNILSFQKDYPESKILRLERNYRSTSNIVEAANAVIAHNEGRIPKKCYAGDERGEKIELLKAWTEQDEAIMIVSDIISRMQKEKAQYQDFAILYRTNSQSRALEEQLRRRNMPYMIYSGNSFFDRAEIKDMMAYFKLVVNTNDDESFKRIVNVPARGIGDTSVSALNECARAHGCSLFKAAFMQDATVFGLRPAGLEKIQAFCRMIDGLAAKAGATDAYDMAKEVADASGYYAFHKLDTSIEGMARTANLDELLNSVLGTVEERQDDFADNGIPEDEFPVVTLADFLENIALLSNVDVSTEEDTNNKVALMTVHSAKGLEFPYVYVAGCEENLFPSGGMLASKQDIEEERRLFYVAITRAKKAVKASYSMSRMRNGKHENNSPSRFLYELDQHCVENPLQKEEAYGSGAGTRSSFSGFGSARGSGSGFGSGRTLGSGFGGGSYGSGSYGSGRRGDSGYKYGSSSNVRFEPRKASFGSSSSFGSSTPSRPAPQPSPAIRPSAAPQIIDPNFVPVDMRELRAGQRIEHNRFGAGKILEITGEYPELKAVVDFDDYGRKQLLLKYAKLRPEK